MTNSYGAVPVSDYNANSAHNSADMFAFDHMAMAGAGTVFGDDGGLNKSPYIGMPEDFMAYLFNQLPNQLSPTGGPFQMPASK